MGKGNWCSPRLVTCVHHVCAFWCLIQTCMLKYSIARGLVVEKLRESWSHHLLCAIAGRKGMRPPLTGKSQGDFFRSLVLGAGKCSEMGHTAKLLPWRTFHFPKIHYFYSQGRIFLYFWQGVSHWGLGVTLERKLLGYNFSLLFHTRNHVIIISVIQASCYSTRISIGVHPPDILSNAVLS